MSSTPVWPQLDADHPIIALFQRLPEIFTASEDYKEIWGIQLAAPKAAPVADPAVPTGPAAPTEPAAATNPATTETATISGEASGKPAEGTPTEETPAAAAAPAEQPDFTTALILQKFLRANCNSVSKAFSQLKDTLVWRKSFFAADGESSKGWSDSKFDGIGFTTVIQDKSGRQKVVSWNIYGATKDIKSTFGNIDEFIRWRVNLMESSLRLLDLGNARDPIPDYGQGDDPYQSFQVHDYMNVSFLRLPSEVKTASKKTIEMFARYYPETLERKFFVNVPVVMSWAYILMKKVVASATMKKLEMLGSGKELTAWIGEDIPGAYGGKAQPLDAGNNGVQSPRDIDAEAAAKKADETKEDAAKEPVKGETAPVSEPTKEPVKEMEANPVKEEAIESVKGEAAQPVKAAVKEEPESAEATTEAATEVTPALKPLPLTAEPVVTEPKAEETKSVEAKPEAEPETAPNTLSDVPIPAPMAVVAKKEE